jgi:hypothetical protein
MPRIVPESAKGFMTGREQANEVLGKAFVWGAMQLIVDEPAKEAEIQDFIWHS